MGVSEERLGFLRKLSEAPGISGYEDAVRAVIREEVKGLGEVLPSLPPGRGLVGTGHAGPAGHRQDPEG